MARAGRGVSGHGHRLSAEPGATNMTRPTTDSSVPWARNR